MNNSNGVMLGCALTSAFSIFGCGETLEPAKSPTDQATQMVRTRCGPDLDESALGPVLDGRALKNVEPLYSSTAGSEGSKGDNQSELRGAVVNVQAVPGVTAEWLDRALECHSAKRVLGQGPQAGGAEDPFWLPGSVVDIDVRSAKDGFRVAVAGTSPAEGQKILTRAQSFANAKTNAGAK
jgi:hypothetical protein